MKAVENEKTALRLKDANNPDALTNAERAKLNFYRKRGSVFLVIGAVGECLETITDRVIPNRFLLNFGEQTSPEDAAQIWSSTVKALSGLHTHLEPAFSDGLKNQEKVRETIRAFSQIVASLREPYASFFDVVKDRLR